jgi:hypothetical protein
MNGKENGIRFSPKDKKEHISAAEETTRNLISVTRNSLKTDPRVSDLIYASMKNSPVVEKIKKDIDFLELAEDIRKEIIVDQFFKQPSSPDKLDTKTSQPGSKLIIPKNNQEYHVEWILDNQASPETRESFSIWKLEPDPKGSINITEGILAEYPAQDPNIPNIIYISYTDNTVSASKGHEATPYINNFMRELLTPENP